MEKYLIREFLDIETKYNYKLISVWHNDYIDLTLIGFKSAWISQITLDNTSTCLSTLGMDYDDYKSTFRTLFDPENSKHFKLVFEDGTLTWFKVVNEDLSIIYGLFVFTKITLDNTSTCLSTLGMDYDDYKSTFRTLFDPENSKHFKLVFEDGTLTWFKVVNEDLSIIYGLFVFTKITDCEVFIEMLEPLSTNFLRLREQIDKLQQEHCKMKNELSTMAENFQQCVEEKLNLENTLYTKFLSVLQKKNATIINLKRKLADNMLESRCDLGEDNVQDVDIYEKPGTSKKF